MKSVPWALVGLLLAYAVFARGCDGGAVEAARAEGYTAAADSAGRIAAARLAQARDDSAAYAALELVHADSSAVWATRRAEAAEDERESLARAERAREASTTTRDSLNVTLDEDQARLFAQYVFQRDEESAGKDNAIGALRVQNVTLTAERDAERASREILFGHYQDLWGVLDAKEVEIEKLRLRGDSWEAAYRSTRGQNRWLKMGGALLIAKAGYDVLAH